MSIILSFLSAPTFASGPYTLVVQVSDGTNKDTVTVNVLEVRILN